MRCYRRTIRLLAIDPLWLSVAMETSQLLVDSGVDATVILHFAVHYVRIRTTPCRNRGGVVVFMKTIASQLKWFTAKYCCCIQKSRKAHFKPPYWSYSVNSWHTPGKSFRLQTLGGFHFCWHLLGNTHYIISKAASRLYFLKQLVEKNRFILITLTPFLYYSDQTSTWICLTPMACLLYTSDAADE